MIRPSATAPRRWLDLTAWNSDRLLVSLMFVLIFALAACMNLNSDTWWLIRTGQEFWQRGSIVTSDIYSWTITGLPWPNHEWLTEVVFYALYTSGGTFLLVGFCAALVSLTWGGIYRLGAGPPRVRAIVMLLGAIDSAGSWSVRPQLISVALFVACLLLLNQPRRHWLYPIILMIWANFHGAFAAGGVVLGIALLVAIVRYRDQTRHWLMVGISSALATLINPHGWGLWVFTLNSLSGNLRQYIEEWQPHSLTRPSSYPFFILAIIVLIVVWRGRRTLHDHRDWVLTVAALIFMVMSVRAIRHSVFFDVLAIVVITRQFSFVRAVPLVTPARGKFHLALVAGCVVGAGLLVDRVWSQRQPVLSAETIAAVRSCKGNLFNTYDIGGELIWFVPERPVFIDNRFDPYPTEFFLRTAAAETRGEYQELLVQYPAQCAIVPVDKPIYSALLRDGWRELHRSTTLAVLQRRQ